jgi:hypothetical protein
MTMKSILLFSVAVLLCLVCHAQAPMLTFTIAKDTSYILFSGFPKLMVTKPVAGKNLNFQMNRRDFKSFLELTTYLQGSRELSFQSLAACEGLVDKKDSVISRLKLKYDAEAQRTENFKANYENSKLINKSTERQLRTCIDDLQKLNNQKRRDKAWTFTKGILLGLAIGSVGGIIAGAAL